MKKTLFSILIALFACLSTQLQAQEQAAPPASSALDSIETSILADRIIDAAQQYIGRPYHYGARGPKQFDCSGFTSYVYRLFGIRLEASSAGQAKQGRAVEEGFEHLQKGDLVLFSRRGRSIGHVGIFIEADTARHTFSFIHAATHGGVMISHYHERYYRAHYRFARRILPDFDAYDLTHELYPFDSTACICPDALALDSTDLRIVLLSSGHWAYVSADGTLLQPADSARIMLSPDGRWARATRTQTAASMPKASADSKASATTAPKAASQATEPAKASATDSTQVASASDASAPQYYNVRKGDTLYQIAKQHGTSVRALCRLNGITEQTVLQIGRRLRVK